VGLGAYMDRFSYSTTIIGRSVDVSAEIADPDPSVGIFTHYIEDIWLEIDGKRAKWLEDRLSKAQQEHLEEETLLLYHEGAR